MNEKILLLAQRSHQTLQQRPHLTTWLAALVLCATMAYAAPVEAVHAPQGSASQLDFPCQADKDNRNSDLCAQWKAADAARDAANWTKAEAIGSWVNSLCALFGTAGLCATLFYTRRSAIDSRAALEEAKKATQSAEEELHIKERLERPYVFGRITNASREDNRSKVNVEVENFGKSLAVLKRLEVAFKIYDEIPEKPEPFLPEHNQKILKEVLASLQSPQQSEVSTEFNEEQAAELKETGTTFFVYGRITYEDAMGQSYQTGFGYAMCSDYPNGVETGGPAYNYRK